MILLPAVILGLLSGWIKTYLGRSVWQYPEFERAWLVVIFFVPQLLAFYLPVTRSQMPTLLVPAYLIISQLGLILFCMLNRHLPGIPILTIGLFLNLVVICANDGVIPLSTVTAAHIIPEQILSNLKVGSRFSLGSKDILLSPDAIVFSWLSDRFVSPEWFPYRFAFSFGDILIDIGAFLLLASPSHSQKLSQER